MFTFGPVVGAEVEDEKGDTIHIISDALNDYVSFGLQEISPSGDTLWQWQPLPGYADPDQPTMAINPSPESPIAGLEPGIMMLWVDMFGLDICRRMLLTPMSRFFGQWMTGITGNSSTTRLKTTGSDEG